MRMISSPEQYIAIHPKQQPILVRLRALLHRTELEEKMKWGMPTYCLQNKNVVGIGAFKDYAGIWFFNGVFLKDESQVLINAQEGKTKGMRQWRFSSEEEMDDTLILSYIHEAINNQKEGKEVKPEAKTLSIPPELKEALAADAQLAETFDTLSTSVKREFAEYITEAKKEETRHRRLQKIIPMIQQGIGLNDKYRKS